ncbi:unnamed protein product [Xylocopa violacea]|uniref:PBZ-type domain-containing protein n=1 Tax=Xylocopa violacea TaxID=135666 RepID=A0ABP1PJ46_XYLVO
MKKLQLLRVDNDLVQKVDLEIGDNIIGRTVNGRNDDRIIKHAVTINVTPVNELTITPVTPCYMKSIESSRWQLLKLGATVAIKPGDICSLLSDKCWFKIISVSNKMDNDNESTLKRKVSEDVNSDMDEKRLCTESGEGDNLQSPRNALNKMLNGSNDPNRVQVEGSLANEEKSLSENKTGEKIQDSSQSPAAINDDYNVENANKANSRDSINGKSFSSEKKSHSSSVSRCARELDDYTSTTANSFRREQCKYGKKCYRKNPQHKAEFSHFGDPDYDALDNREECPYGAKCYRTNPQHKMQFKHTAVNITSKHNKERRKKRSAQRTLDTLSIMENLSAEESMDESVDESEYELSSDVDESDYEHSSDIDESTDE